MANYKETIRQVCITPGIFEVQDNNILKMNYIGICRENYPDWEGWQLIDLKIENINLDPLIKNNWKTIGKYLKTSGVINGYIIDFYRKSVWDKLLLSDLIDQGTANMIFHSVFVHGISSTKRLLIKLTNNKGYNIQVINQLNIGYLIKGYEFYINYFKAKINRYLKIHNRYERISKKLFNVIEIDLKILNQTIDIENINRFVDIIDITNLNEFLNNEQNTSIIKRDTDTLIKLMSVI